MPIEMIPALPDNVVGVIAKGKVQRSDYESTIDPAVEEAVSHFDKIRLLYVLGDDFEGFSAGAAWEDGELGIKHLTRFEKIAVVTDKDWIGHAVNLFGYLMPGKVKVFSVAEEADASEWVTAP
jgi:hypothetical protein